MKPKATVMALLLAALPLFTAGAAAQHAQHHPAQMRSEAKPQGQMMMAPMGPRMMAHHQEIEKLVNQLTQSLAALENEKDPAVLRSKLAEDRALLEQFQAKLQQGREMMQGMADHMKTCPMMESGQKAK